MLQSSLSYRSTRKERAGFTLAELLIVVAIILVLVAIAVPVFTGLVGDSEEATCAANRRTVKSAFAASFTLDSSQDKDALFTQCVTSLKSAKQEKLCPSGGNYTPSFDANGNLTVQCSIHGISMDDEMYTNLASMIGDAWDKGYKDLEKVLGVKIVGDHDLRIYYTEKNSMDNWPKLDATTEKGKQLYLEFKSYNNQPSGLFLYAGTNPDPQSDDWKAYYICDNTGLLGEDSKGQWYRVEAKDGLYATSKDKVLEALEASKDNKVSLVNGKFV